MAAPLSPPDFDEEERRAKSKRLMLIVVLTLLALAVFIYVNPFKKTGQGGSGAQVGGNPSGVAAAGLNNQWSENFPLRQYSVDDYKLRVEHSLVADASGREDTVVLSNDGDKKIDFTLVNVIPQILEDDNFSINTSVYRFADADASQTKVATSNKDYSLQPGEQLVVKVWSGSARRVGILFIPVINGLSASQVAEVKDILERKVNDNEIRLLELTPQDADKVADEITKRLNSPDGIAALNAYAVTAVATVVPANETEFYATASEALPASFIDIPLFVGKTPEEAQRSSVLLQGVEGELAQYLFPGYPKPPARNEATSETTVQIAFDFRKALVRGGLFWDDANKAPKTSFEGDLVFAPASKANEPQRIHIRVEARHVGDSALFVIASPAEIVFSKNDKSTKKPLFFVNSYSFPVSVSGCGFKDGTSIPAQGFDYRNLSSADAGCLLKQNGVPIYGGVKTADYATDAWTDEIGILSESTSPGRECIDAFCGCDALKDFLTRTEDRFTGEIEDYYSRNPNTEAAAKTVMQNRFERTFVVLASETKNCDFSGRWSGFAAQASDYRAAYAIKLSAQAFGPGDLSIATKVNRLLEEKRG